jgi:3-oxoadipate enol-lactonase
MAALAATTYDVDSLDVPVLLVCGELDPLMTPALVRDVATRLGRARVEELSGRGHSPYFEDPEGWNGVVGAFLDEQFPGA